jgi:hypothetical protein
MKSKQNRNQALLFGLLTTGGQNFLVTQMQTIEGSDGENRLLLGRECI